MASQFQTLLNSYGQDVVDAIKPRLLFATRDDEMDAVLHLSEDESDRKERCLRVHEALVTLRDDGGDGLLRRPPLERYDFFGEDATFPAGPVLLASVLKVPVQLFFGLYLGNNRYALHFEHFADEIVLGRGHRDEDVQMWTQRYADRLEHYARLAPYNWFNFYDFWAEG